MNFLRRLLGMPDISKEKYWTSMSPEPCEVVSETVYQRVYFYTVTAYTAGSRELLYVLDFFSAEEEFKSVISEQESDCCPQNPLCCKEKTEITPETEITPDLADEDISYHPNGFPSDLVYTVQGMGKTTGAVAKLTIYNPTNRPITIAATEFLMKGVENTQNYKCFVPEFTVQPGETIEIDIEGECLNIRKLPLGEGQEGGSVEDWITTTLVGPAPKPGDPLDPAFDPITLTDGPFLTYPGSDIPFTASINLDENLLEAAPLIFEIDRRINRSFEMLWTENQIDIPISRDRAYAEGRQQAKWYVYSILEGEPYVKEELRKNVEKQFEEVTGKPVASLPESAREQIDDGVTDIWTMVTIVGTEAKVTGS
jgi:hypothetical protein